MARKIVFVKHKENIKIKFKKENGKTEFNVVIFLLIQLQGIIG